MKHILSIQYLRAAAALSVVACHTGHFLIGNMGVDLFFVISGFIMFTITENQEKTPSVFFWRRLVRIVPLYWGATVLTIVLTLVWPHLIYGADISFTHLLASFLFIPHATVVYGEVHIIPTLAQGWSLNYEMFFYVLVTASLFLPRNVQLPLLSVLFIGLVFAGIYFSVSLSALATVTNNMSLEFLAGLWIGKFWALKAMPGRKTGFLLIGAGLLSLCLEQTLKFSSEDLRPCVPAVLIVFGTLSIEAHGGIRYMPFLKLLGDSSYAIYLMHDFVVWGIINMHLPSDIDSFFAIMTFSIMAGVITFLRIEQPMSRVLRKIPPWHFLH